MSDKVQLIKQEIKRLKNEQLSIFSKGENDEICGTALIHISVYNQLLSLIDSLPEEPIVKEITWKDVNTYDIEEPASKDLEEAASEWDKTASFQPFYMQLDCKGNPCDVKQDITTHKESFKAGAEWQKQQMNEALQTEYEKGLFDMQKEMMKDAVDATILDVDAQTIEFGLWPEKLLDIKQGNKVKIIIIKEEQQ